MRCHSLTYKIYGDDLQFVSIGLAHGQTLVAEAGSLMFMTADVQMETGISDGSDEGSGVFSKLWHAGKRALSGESFFLIQLTGMGATPGQAALAGPYVGKIIPIDLGSFSSSILCQRGAFLAAAYGTKIDVAFTRNLSSGLFGGEGFILQRLSGDGMAFLHACGRIAEISLHGQSIRITPGCIVAFEESISYDIESTGSFANALFGAKTLFFAKLSGHGKVWLQSLPFNLLANRICEEAKKQGFFDNKREQSSFGSFG